MPDAADPDMVAAEFALGVLEGQERDRARRRLLTDPAFARDVDDWRYRLAGLFDAYREVGAPATVAIPAAAGRGPVRRHPWLAVALPAALAASVAAILISRPGTAPPPAPVPVERPHRLLMASLMTTDQSTAVPVLVDLTTDRIRISPVDLTPAGKSAELWAIGADGSPKALGLLSAGGASRLTVPRERRRQLAVGVTLAVSIEPVGGSPTGLPTGPVVASGKLSIA